MFYAIMDGFFFRIDALIHKIYIGWVSPSCLAFLKSKMSSSVAGIANCKGLRAGGARSNGKHDVRSCTACPSLCIRAKQLASCSFW